MFDPVTIDVDMDKTCTRCGAMGATQRGICLECIGKEITDRLTDKGRAMTRQMSLTTEMVDLSPEERIERGRQLADTLLALVRMQNDHALSKKAMKADEEQIEVEIARLRDVIRSGQEERPVGVSR